MKHTLTLALMGLLLAGCGVSSKVAEQKDPVNVGYGTVDKDKLTTAVSKVDVKKREIQTYSTVYDYLRGRVPGVMVTSDNRIIIRGIGTNSGNTDPLILVDGVAVSASELANINPGDIQSVEVLKDGSSAIYGIQGANGVILISTKH